MKWLICLGITILSLIGTYYGFSHNDFVMGIAGLGSLIACAILWRIAFIDRNRKYYQ